MFIFFACRYGPPGTGKTLLAKAVATESEANFMAVSIPELIKGEVGESEKAIARVFKTASKCSPCIIFLDELEAIFGTRESSGGLGKQVRMSFLRNGEGERESKCWHRHRCCVNNLLRKTNSYYCGICTSSLFRNFSWKWTVVPAAWSSWRLPIILKQSITLFCDQVQGLLASSIRAPNLTLMSSETNIFFFCLVWTLCTI